MIITNAKWRAVWRLEGDNTFVFDHWEKLWEGEEECITVIGNIHENPELLERQK